MYIILFLIMFVFLMIVALGLFVIWKKMNIELEARDKLLFQIVQDLTRVSAAMIGVTRLIESISLKILDKSVDKNNDIE